MQTYEQMSRDEKLRYVESHQQVRCEALMCNLIVCMCIGNSSTMRWEEVGT